MLPSQAPKYYLVGALLSAFGLLLLAFRLRPRGRPTRLRWPLVAAGVLALAVGVAVIGAGLRIDADYSAYVNTTTLWYHVSVLTNGSGSIRLLLPAPVDSRFFGVLNVTNGSASMRLNHTMTDTNVELTAHGNVSFEVQASVPSPAVNWGFSRVTVVTVGSMWNATIELRAPPGDVGVVLTLNASIGAGCTHNTLTIESAIEPGIREYPALALGVTC